MPTVTRLDHLAVTVSDMDRSLAFYCGLLGMEKDGEHDLQGRAISKMTGKQQVIMKVVRLICRAIRHDILEFRARVLAT